MSYILVDIEADGPIPGDFSMIELGAILVAPDLSVTFHARLRPISDRFLPEALSVTGHSREETLAFPPPETAMQNFEDWIKSVSSDRPIFLSDNNGFDWMFACWYFHHFLGRNPFGHSSQNLGSLYKGLVRDMSKNFKHLRKTAHTHNPVDDVRGNAEAFLTMIEKMGLKARL